jgi:two-component system, NarL family, sensor kinase
MENSLSFYFGLVIAMCSFIVIAIGFTIVFVRYQRRLLRKQRELHQVELRHKEDLLVNSIQSTEEERMRIAKDIHDELGGIFSSLSLSIDQLKKEGGALSEEFETAKKLVATGINSVRRISRALVPFELELFGLEQTLENHFETISSLSSIQILFENKCDLKLIKSETALSIYRIVQELTSNCIKYAQAKNLIFKILENNGHLELFYKDDGVGMNRNSLSKGIGLKNIESRVISLNGSLVINSEPGMGFTSSVSIPLK